MKEKTACSPGINWVWFLKYRIPQPSKIEILKHWRVHYGDEMPEHEHKSFLILEVGQDKYGNRHPGYKIGDPRIADRVILGGDYTNPLKVVNPKGVFDYKEES